MPKQITIGTQVIDFPTTGEDAVWSEAIVEFAELTAIQLQTTTNIYDLPLAAVNLDNTSSSFQDIPKLPSGIATFPSSNVRSFVFSYSINRKNTALVEFVETGTVTGSREDTTGTWTLNHQFIGPKINPSGGYYHEFNMNGDDLQIKINNAEVGPLNIKISYIAKTLLK